MADYLPEATGLWTTTTWITSLANLTAFAGNPPMSADDVWADGRTIWIDTNIHVASLRTTTAPRTGGVAGGGFRVTSNISLTASIIPGTTTCLLFASASPAFFSLSGSIVSSTNQVGYFHGGSGTANIIAPRIANFSTGRCIELNATGGTINLVSPSIASNSSSHRGETNSAAIYVFGSSCVLNITGIVTAFYNPNSNPNSPASIAIVGSSNVVNMSGSILPVFGGTGVWINSSTTVFNLIGTVGTNAASNTTIRCIEVTSGTVNVIGNVFMGNGTAANNIGDCGILVNDRCNITGNVFGGQSGTFSSGGESRTGAVIVDGGTLNMVGNVTGGFASTNAPGIRMQSGTGTVSITGNIIAGAVAPTNAPGCPGMLINTSGSININGNAVGATGVGIINSSSTSRLYIKRVVGGPGGPTNPTGGVNVGLSNTQNGLAYVEEIQFGAQGATPVSGPVFLVNRPNTVLVMEGPPPTFTETTLFGNLNVPNLFPPVSSVRSGIFYGNGDFEGTMVVPPRDAVQVGVPVDDTVGTFVLSPESFWTIQRSNSAFDDPTTIGYRIKNLATIASVGQQIASFNLYPPTSAWSNLEGSHL